MKRRTRNTGQVMPVLLTLTVLLVTGCVGSMTTTSPTPTPTSTTPVMGDFIGPVTGLLNVYIGLTTDGQTLTALATDGTDNHITKFLKFDGPVTNNTVKHLKDEFGTGADLIATLTPKFATGTVTYKDVLFPFTVQPQPTGSPIHAGLYQGELTTAGGVRYLAGWVVLPGTAVAQVQRGGIINERTRALKPAPALTALDIASGQVVEPSLGAMFRLTLFQLGKPVAIPSNPDYRHAAAAGAFSQSRGFQTPW